MTKDEIDKFIAIMQGLIEKITIFFCVLET